ELFEYRVVGGVAATGAAPGKRHKIVGERYQGGRHVAREFFGVVDDISFEVHSRALGRAGVGEDDDRSVRVHAAQMTLVDNGVVDHGVKIALLRIHGLIAIIDEVAEDGDFGGVAAVVPAADGAGRVRGAAVLVQVQKDVSLDPRIRAIEVEPVIIAAGDDVINELHDRLARPVSSSEINHVIVAVRLAEKVAQENSASATLDTTGAVARLELRDGGGKVAMADDKRCPIHVNIRRAHVA